MPSGISVSGVTSAPAATIARAPIRAPSRTVEPLPTRHSSPRKAACTVQLWPIVAPAPTSVPWRGVTCTTGQCCTAAARRTTVGLKAARRTALYQTGAFSSTVTSPTSTAVGAMKAVGCALGLFPSKLNSGMGSGLAVCSKCSHLTRTPSGVEGRMSVPRITAVATATPRARFTQPELLALAGYHDAQRRGFFSRSGIEGRHLYIDRATFRPDDSVDELGDRFRCGALELGEGAARLALARAGWEPADVDFIATTTCTGRLTPSLDAHLIGRLGLRPDVQRVHVGDTGCAAAMVALQQAWNHLRAFPGRRALVLAVEICSAVYFLDDRLESAVAHAICAAGAGALALATVGPAPSVVAHRPLRRPEHLDAMGFEYPGGRPRVILSKDVRRIGATMLGEMVRVLMDAQGLKREDVRYWVLHSAGRRVLERARTLLELDDATMRHSRSVLRHYGNMSSATILFVLDEMLRQESPVPGEWGVMIGLGPGFAAEGALLSW